MATKRPLTTSLAKRMSRALAYARVLMVIPCLLSGSNLAWGQAFDYHVSNHILAGRDKATFKFLPPVDLYEVRIEIRSKDEVVVKKTFSKVKGGQEIILEWSQARGVTHYTGMLGFDIDAGDDYQVPLEFSITAAKSLEFEVPLDRINPDTWELALKPNGPLASVHVTVIGEDHQTLFASKKAYTGQEGQGWLTLPWGPVEGEPLIIALDLVATDGFVADYRISTWSYAVPHQDIAFPSGSSQIPETQTELLQESLQSVQQILNRYGNVVDMNLYIAGYTDTVDSRASNEALSRQRAQAIASFFKRNGFNKPIYYQGFGERVLAVPTGDGVDMPANRRAIYVLAAQPPSDPAEYPNAQWLGPL